jgi:threonine/homoserine/homoserine lactone efflux protein
MLEVLITVSIIGLIAGFIFSAPAAGPIAVLVISNALQGKKHFCGYSALGAAIIDFIYCFIAIFGFATIYEYYAPLLPYTLLAGAFFIFYVGIRLMRQKLEIERFESVEVDAPIQNARDRKEGFMAGFMYNAMNPSLFFGWLFSTLVIMSFAASLGFNVAGLDAEIGNNVNMMNGSGTSEAATEALARAEAPEEMDTDSAMNSRWYKILLATSYAFFVAIGTILWFYPMALVIIKYRDSLKLTVITRTIQSLGLVLCGFGVYLLYQAYSLFTQSNSLP